MRTLTETEMRAAAGGVATIPNPFVPPGQDIPEQDPMWVDMMMELMFPREPNMPE